MRGMMMLAGTAAIGLTMFIGVPVQAQEVSTSLTAVRQCLCAQGAVAAVGRDMRESKRRDERMHGDVDALSHQVEDARGRVNTDNRNDIEAFRALLARRDAAAESLWQEDQRHAAVVARYNSAVAQNNAVCVGRLFDQEEVESIKVNLVCPRP